MLRLKMPDFWSFLATSTHKKPHKRQANLLFECGNWHGCLLYNDKVAGEKRDKNVASGAIARHKRGKKVQKLCI